MTIELAFLFMALSGVIGVATFFIGRTTAAKNEGATLEGMRKDIGHIVESVKEIKESLDKRDTKYDDSIRRVHDRIDEHIRLCHSGG